MTHPYPPRTKQDCGNCFYLEELYFADCYEVVQKKMECRRHAPKPGSHAIWPDVKESNWCGEWAPQEVPE